MRKLILTLLALIMVGGQAMADTMDKSKYEQAIFAAGCFWCIEKDMEHVDGVIEAVSGYTGGDIPNPSYHQVSNGNTGHVEAVRVTFDPAIVSYEELLHHFWVNVDPENPDGQFCDYGTQYNPEIHYLNDEQKAVAEKSKAMVSKTGDLKNNYVTIKPAKEFWEAEEYHQDYYKKNPIRYKFYRNSCKRDKRLDELWGKQRQSPISRDHHE